ncbi:MAG: hypothetical protein GXO91_01030 [FCB group bacterium]|nr:hypothetical protein [FCB group bacterium]
MKTILFALAALLLLLMGVSIQKVWDEYRTHQLIITDAGGIPPGSIWYGWVSDGNTALVNYCYSSGSTYEEFLMVKVVKSQYHIVKRNLVSNLHLTQPLKYQPPKNEKILPSIHAWWDESKLKTLSSYAPRNNSEALDRIAFDDAQNTIYFYALRSGDFKRK